MNTRLLQQYQEVKSHLKLLQLEDRYFQIFEFRNGISDGVRHTLTNTGEHFGISGTRVRQIEARVLEETKRAYWKIEKN